MSDMNDTRREQSPTWAELADAKHRDEKEMEARDGFLRDVVSKVREAHELLVMDPRKSRVRSIAATKLEEAEIWLAKELRELSRI